MATPTLAQAIEHLRQGSRVDDDKIQQCLDAAVILSHKFLDAEPLTVVPDNALINAAILIITETLYDNRAAGNGVILQPGSTEWMLLFPFRRVGV